MSEPKHTPGPWCVRQRDPLLIEDNIGRYISMTNIYMGADMNVLQANARLIAAAPEMLEALEIVFDVIEGAEGPTRTLSGNLIRWETIVEMVQNAIAKATYRDNYDAQLIDAAPEMLEALEEIVSWLASGSLYGTDGPSRRAEAAIAKATGKEEA